eukprot:s829_g20.t1
MVKKTWFPVVFAEISRLIAVVHPKPGFLGPSEELLEARAGKMDPTSSGYGAGKDPTVNGESSSPLKEEVQALTEQMDFERKDYNWEGYLERPSHDGSFEKVFVEIRNGQFQVLHNRGSQSLLSGYPLSSMAGAATITTRCARSFEESMEGLRLNGLAKRNPSVAFRNAALLNGSRPSTAHGTMLRLREPQKGKRHSCGSGPAAGPALDEAKPSPSSFRARAPCATAGAMCASIASLASKNPGLWKSKRSLARCGGDDFMAALIFMAAGKESWTKNSKQALLLTMNLVAHEAATALQRCWRGRRRARESSQTLATAEAVSGYVAKAATHHGTFGRRRPRLVEPSAPSPVASDKAQTAMRKSNPRPVQSRAVPVNPLQAMKLRMAQQQQEAEERRILGRQEAEDARQARVKPLEPAGARGQALGAPVLAAPAPTLVLPEVVDEHLMSTPPTSQSTMEALLANLAAPPLQSERDRQDMQDSTADSTPKLDGKSSDAGESMLTPLELRKLRTEASKVVPSDSPVAEGGRSVAPPAAATERLRDRLRKRESAGKTEQRNTARSVEVANASQVNWKERIELRHKEAEEQQVQEKEEKQRTAERSSKRSDALRRVMERREQRHQESLGLEED